MSNQWLRVVVTGGLLHLDVLVACNLLRLIASLKVEGKIVWHNRVGTPLGAFRCWMKTCDFGEDSPWSWRMSGVRVSLCGNINIDLQKHNLRNGWKIFCWKKFLASGRHEAVDLQNVPVSRVLASVVLGATVSPAWLHDRDVDGNSACLRCSSLGTWDHLCWCCPASPLERPVCPRDALLRRFGWLHERDPTEILNYLAQVQQMIWDHRYRSGESLFCS